jgi:Ca2+-binding EF-hand superfamily protein
MCVQVISPEEFRTGCAVLNEHLPEKQRLTDIDHMLNLMDFDGNGMVDVNEFFEVNILVLMS